MLSPLALVPDGSKNRTVLYARMASAMSQTFEPVYLDEVLRPNPPMRPAVLRVILLIVAAMNIMFAVGFMLRGAWPIAPFMGLDVALLYWAFRTSEVAARAFEHVRLTTSQLSILYRSGRGEEKRTELNPYWVTVNLEEPADMPRKLWLRSHGKSIQIGSFLGPRERLNFAQELRAALRLARSPDFP